MNKNNKFLLLIIFCLLAILLINCTITGRKYRGLYDNIIDDGISGDLLLLVLGENKWAIGDDISLRVFLFEPESGNVLSDVEIGIQLEEFPNQWRTLYVGNTDIAGSITAHFKVPLISIGNYNLRIQAKYIEQKETLTYPIILQNPPNAFIETNSETYTASDTISFCLYIPQLSSYTNPTDIDISLIDSLGNIINQDKWYFAADNLICNKWLLPDNLTNGNYKLIAQLDTLLSLSTSLHILPLSSANISINSEKSYYSPGATAYINVSVDDTLLSEGGFAILDIYDLDEKEKRLERIKQPLKDANTLFRLDLSKYWKSQIPEKQFVYLKLKSICYAKDTYLGETETNIILSSKPIYINSIAENGKIVPNVKNRLWLYAAYPDGKTSPADLLLVSREQKINLHTSENGLAQVELTPADNIKLHLSAKLRDGTKSSRSISLQAESNLLIRTNKAFYNLTDTLQVEIFSPLRDRLLYLDILQEGNSIYSTPLHLKNNYAIKHIVWNPEQIGLFQIVIYWVNPDGIGDWNSNWIWINNSFDSPFPDWLGSWWGNSNKMWTNSVLNCYYLEISKSFFDGLEDLKLERGILNALKDSDEISFRYWTSQLNNELKPFTFRISSWKEQNRLTLFRLYHLRKGLEEYNEQFGRYPPGGTWRQKLEKYKLINNPRWFYDAWGELIIYHRQGRLGDKYILYSIGRDGENETRDDIYP